MEAEQMLNYDRRRKLSFVLEFEVDCKADDK